LAESDLTKMEFCAMPETSNDDIKTLSFEAALAQLEEIVGKLESGRAPLAESIAIYERGAQGSLRDAAAHRRSADRENHPLA
jgi:hypothetical protein